MPGAYGDWSKVSAALPGTELMLVVQLARLHDYASVLRLTIVNMVHGLLICILLGPW